MAGTTRTRTRRAALATLAAATLAGGMAATAAQSASAADPQRVRIVTANVNFGADKDKIVERFNTYSKKADVVLLQEAKWIDMKWRLRNDSRWVVRQDLGSDATQGSAVIVRRSIVNSLSDIGPLNLRLGTNSNENCDALPRYIAHVKVTLKNGGVLRPASAHLPPKRCQHGPGSDYDEMVTSIAQMSANHPKHLVVGGDWNKVVLQDPNGLKGQTNGRLVPRAPSGSIDGFYKPSGLGQEGSADTVGYASDGHKATRIIVKVPSGF